jgi:hypothetical protein
MSRLLSALFALAVCSVAGMAAPPTGTWKFRTMLNERPVTLLIAFSQADGKCVCDFLDSRPQLNREPKVSAVTVNGEAVQFTMSVAGREFLSFDGTVAKDGKKINGSFSQLGNSLQLTELIPSKLNKLTDPFEMNREAFDQVDNTTGELFDIGFELLPQAAAKKMTPDEVRGLVDRLTKASSTYGARWDRTVALKIASVLVDQPGFAEIALTQARRAERMLAESDTIGDRMDVLDILNRSLVKSNKADEAKPITTQMVRLEARDFADYIKASPLGEAPEYKGRKAKSDRVVLVEAFVGTEFPLSAPIEQSLDAMMRVYKPTDVLALNYHFHLPEPSQGDPLTVPETSERLVPLIEQIQRGTFLFVAGKAGPKITSPAVGKEFFTAIQTAIDEQLEKPAGCTLTLSVAKGMKGSDVKATVADLDVGSNKIALRFAVIEPRIRFAGGSGARYHQNVVRALPGGGKGFPLTKKQTEQVVTVDPNEIRIALTKSLDEFAKNDGVFPRAGRPMELKNLKVIAFVQNDSTGDILHAASIDLDAK